MEGIDAIEEDQDKRIRVPNNIKQVGAKIKNFFKIFIP
jgi:hypothetical protein